MSRSGAPAISVTAPDVRVAIVAASWHEQVMDGLVEGAHRGLTAAGVTDITEVRVPGTFELPVACATLAGRFDALVALGVVIRGGSPHFDYVCAGATHGLTEAICSRESERSCAPAGGTTRHVRTTTAIAAAARLAGSGAIRAVRAVRALMRPSCAPGGVGESRRAASV